jgi:hypothetical protein
MAPRASSEADGAELRTTGLNDHFDGLVRRHLNLKTGVIPMRDQIYARFKEYASSSCVSCVESLLSDLADHAKYYRDMALWREEKRRLRQVFQDLRELKAEVAYPFLLMLSADHRQEVLSEDDLVAILRLVESHVFRRSVCSIPSNSLDKTFVTIGSKIDKGKHLESVKARWPPMKSRQRFPLDEEFKRKLKVKDLYKNRRLYRTRRLESFDNKEPVQPGDYSVERVMPQNKNLSGAWRAISAPNGSGSTTPGSTPWATTPSPATTPRIPTRSFP